MVIASSPWAGPDVKGGEPPGEPSAERIATLDIHRDRPG